LDQIDQKQVAEVAAAAANMAAKRHEDAFHSDPPSPKQQGVFRGPDGKISTNRVIAHISTYAGAFALVAGAGLAFVESLLKTGTTNGKDIALAGLGALITGGATKVGGGFSERPNGGGQ